MKSKRLGFEAHPTKDPVSAILQVPQGADALVVLGHGAGAGMEHANMEGIANALHQQQIATFRYQFPFMERGGGRDSKEVSVSTVRNACACAIQLTPKLLHFAGGHSFGGRMTSVAASESDLPSIQGLIFFAFPLHPPGKPATERADPLSQINVPMLFLSGTRDKLFTVDLFKPVLAKLKRGGKSGKAKSGKTSSQTRPKAELHLLDTAEHGYKILKRTRKSDESVFDEMARVARQWIG